MDIANKIKSHLLLGKQMRDTQKLYFKLSKTAYTERNKVLAQSKALERQYDESLENMLQLLSEGFQPELFR